MSDLASKLTSRPKGHTGLPCGVGVILGVLDDTDRATVEAALADPGTSDRHLAETLRGHLDPGLVRVPGYQQFGKHRRGECRCGRHQ